MIKSFFKNIQIVNKFKFSTKFVLEKDSMG